MSGGDRGPRLGHGGGARSDLGTFRFRARMTSPEGEAPNRANAKRCHVARARQIKKERCSIERGTVLDPQKRELVYKGRCGGELRVTLEKWSQLRRMTDRVACSIYVGARHTQSNARILEHRQIITVE